MEKKYYHGIEVSAYGQEHGFVDYRTFFKGLGGGVLCNNINEIMEKLGDYSAYDTMTNLVSYSYEDDNGNYYEFESYSDFEEWREEQENSEDIEEPEEHYTEVYQYCLINDTEWNRKDIEDAHEPYFYCESLDCLVLCVTHWGTAWDYVLTSIKL